MKVISYRNKDGTESVGLLRGDSTSPIDLIKAIEMFAVAHDECVPLISNMLDILDAGLLDVRVLNEITQFVDIHGLVDCLNVADGYQILAPIAHPRSIYALGRNYPAHAKEGGGEVPTEPIIFGKAVSAVIGPNDQVVYKKFLARVDPEAELAVVVGKCGSNISEEDAPFYIAGYTIVNDVTARELQNQDFGHSYPWFRSKGIDTFCPMGPNITLTDEITFPVELDVEMRVNGELRQKDNSRSITFSIPFIISWLSRYHTLYPGDVISTGTPEGMIPVFPGDVMEAYVEKIGVLRNTVVAE